MSERELARITASAPRRALGVGALGGLGLLLIWIAITTPPVSVLWLAFLVGAGVVSLVLAQLMWRATAISIVLTEEGLFDSTGQEIARTEDITRVDRGVFALKPSNGFSLQLRKPGRTVWRPGLWWRSGRRVAVGGVTAGHQTRPVADILALRVSERPAREG
ncbi:hypothetical protein [Citreimonas sp.]|uniref:hypothetical protein n=1 Tax=Citreimonas sp. TaxID=3036715 RepID=UPI0035C87BFF